MQPLAPDQIATRVASLERWTLTETGRLHRRFSAPDFAAALAFANRIGEEAERLNHHPDVLIGWGRVEVTLWTHDAGGLTDLDFDLASRVDGASDELGG